MTRESKPAIQYVRVSTRSQGRSGLGLAAQEEACDGFARLHGFQYVERYVEVETAKGDTLARRPKLREALARARKLKCPIIVSRLDRLSRDVHFISGLMAHKVNFIVAALGPEVDSFMLHVYAAIAEQERKMISIRTKEGLMQARRRGKVLGGRNAQSDRNAAAAHQHAETLRPLMAELSHLSTRKCAEELNRREVETPLGNRWHANSVVRLRRRLAAEPATSPAVLTVGRT